MAPDLRLVHSSSFSASFRSTSALTCDSSSWIRRVLVSSSSRVPWGAEEAVRAWGPECVLEEEGAGEAVGQYLPHPAASP